MRNGISFPACPNAVRMANSIPPQHGTSMRVMLLGPLSVRAAEPIPFRGVVEGYYGRPWGTEGRLSLLKFMGENDMNVFIYGPKDDPYHHGKWREPYPAAEMADFQKLLKVAKANKILFTWAIHLGGSFKKGNEADYEALFRKLGWMYDAGFRAFAVFFDDFGIRKSSAFKTKRGFGENHVMGRPSATGQGKV